MRLPLSQMLDQLQLAMTQLTVVLSTGALITLHDETAVQNCVYFFILLV
jgi:hypothetical protein